MIAGLLVAAAPAHAAPPPLLSQDRSAPDVRSAAGSGDFGRWTTDRFGLPAYDYTLDQTKDPRAQRKEIGGIRDAWSQLGNDAIIANAYVDGYTQLWSQARQPQWANKYDPANLHFGGGFGYLREGDRTLTTSWLDNKRISRRFGVGYTERRLTTDDLQITEQLSVPFGDDPVVVHEIRLRNRLPKTRRATWWEYWDVNPYDQFMRQPRGLEPPAYDARTRTLSVKHTGDGYDDDPMSIFLTAADAPVAGFETDAKTFFGDGGRAKPAAVQRDKPSNATDTASAFALRSPVTLKPNEAVTLRYVYGLDHAAKIDRDSKAAGRAATARAWKRWLPRADFGSDRRWMARELQWSAYSLRSASQWEELCGHHVITQGGLYQYGSGMQIGFRDPLQYALPMVYAHPELAREILRYSMQEQTPGTGGPIPFGIGPQCMRDDHLGFSSDFDFWLLLAAAEYTMGTRDLAFLDEQIPYRGGVRDNSLGSASVWEHLKLAYRHQETLAHAPNGNYVSLTGDWSDLALALIPMDESVLLTAQLAYAYPRLAELADLRGDRAFAAEVRARAQQLLDELKTEWTGRGWYARGYFGGKQQGRGAIFGEPQPWGLLAGGPTGGQERTLIANIDRFLAGRGAPKSLGGPAKIGSGISPAAADPEVTEWAPGRGPNDKGDAVEGGVWYSINGPLTWALAKGGHGARAFDEWGRNSLTAHARAYPAAWNGILNVDDVCESFASANPDQCGLSIGLMLTTGYAGQNTHPPSWFTFGAIKQAGIEPTRDGYRIAPSFPLRTWQLRTETAGVAREGDALRGYLRPERDGRIVLEVVPPSGGPHAAWVDGERVATSTSDGALRLIVSGRRGRALDWAVRPAPPARRSP